MIKPNLQQAYLLSQFQKLFQENLFVRTVYIIPQCLSLQVFQKRKPLTLMNGANLLFLLEKHGHKAKIDLKEAKELNNQNNL